MKVYILRWNPEISYFKKKNYNYILKMLKKEDCFLDWSVYDWKKVKPGDAVVLCQVGTENDGIAILGKFISKPYERNSWRKDGTRVHYANIHIFTAFDRDIETCLSAKSLESLFSEIDWHGGHSGIVLDTKTGKNLIAEIDKILEESKKTSDTNFSTFLKNDNRFLSIDFLDKKTEILKIFEPYNPVAHTCDEPDYGEWLDENEFFIEVPNKNSYEPLTITLSDRQITLFWEDWHQHFDSTNYGYEVFLDRLKGILENRYCILKAFQSRKLQKNQKKQTYKEVAWFISTKTYTKDSDKKKIFKEFDVMKKDFPNICRIKVVYWDAERSFSVKEG